MIRLLLTALIVLSPVCAFALDLKTIFEETAVTSPARVEFREEKHNPMLKEPIILTGYLEYFGPGHLSKVIETPYQEAFLVVDNQVEITRDGKSRHLSLSKSRPLRAMLGGIEAIIAGQVDKIDELFLHELSGTSCAWSLMLEPKSKRVSAHLTAMLVTGGEDGMSSMRIELKEGEWSLMEILKAEPES